MIYRGIDALGISHKKFPLNLLCDFYRNAQPGTRAIGYLMDTSFGPLDNIEKFNAAVAVDVARVHLLNNTAVRNGKLDKNELLNGYTLDKIRREINTSGSNIYKIIDRQFNKLASLKLQGQVWVSIFLEHNYGPAEVSKLLQYCLKNHATKFKIFVDSPVVKSYNEIPGTFLEVHGNRKGKAAIRSNDGANISDADFYSKENNYYNAATELNLLWWGELNIRRSGANPKENPDKDRFVMPRDRGMYLPTLAQFETALHYIKEPQPAPKNLGVLLKDPQVWKPLADNNLDSKSFKPVLIIKSRSSELKIVSVTGKQIGTMKNVGSFQNTDRSRFYANDFAYKLVRANQGEWASIVDGRNKYCVNLVRRTGLLRDE